MGPDDLRSLADRLTSEAASVIPDDVGLRYLILVEATRAVDFWTLADAWRLTPDQPGPIDLQIIQWGWNSLAGRTLAPLPSPLGVPLGESSDDAQLTAMSLLHQFGRAALLRRSADMVSAGILATSVAAGKVHINTVGSMAALQAADLIERDRWRSLERQHEPADDFARFKLEADDLEARLEALAFPWPTGRGVMMGYDAEPEVDDHFSAIAFELVDEWRTEAGIHPNTRIGGVTGSDLTAVAGQIISLHFKHARFTMAAVRRFPEISFRQSLTIWKERRLLLESLASYTPLPEEVIKECLDLLALRSSDIEHLSRESHVFRPLLIDLGNGFDLYPISSAHQNPFSTIRRLLEWRDPKMISRFSAPREEWLREHLYALFQGNRYRRIQGNIKIRREGRIVTDIDAALYDVVSSDVALFQIKWQNFDTNDVRALRSRAKNFVEDVDAWADALAGFLHVSEASRLRQVLRLGTGDAVKNVHLFAISRSAARFRGYGYDVRNEAVAAGTWHQFCRARHEVGPVEDVFGTLHRRLKEEAGAAIQGRPRPYEVQMGDQTFVFHDLWNSFEHPEPRSASA